MKISTCVVFFAIALCGCAANQPLLKKTTSGHPEGVFRNQSVESVKAKIIDGCSSAGILVQEATANQVVCGKTMQGTEAAFAQMMVGNSYSTTPQRKIRFIIYQQAGDVKVTAQQWIESQMAYGQTRQQELKNSNHINDVQQFLYSLGGM